jgi:small subunit ribosomal protein S19e
MAHTHTIDPQEHNKQLALVLKESGDFTPPAWVSLVKSGAGRMRPIDDPDFWYKRAASILRQMHMRGIIGVERLRTRYGNRKNRGMRPAEFRKSAGKLIRVILQQAETAGLVEKAKGKKAGRQLTAQGKKLIEEVKA